MTSNKEIFQTAFARFAAGDVDVLHGVLREDFVTHNPANPSGRDAWVAFVKSSPATMEMRHVIADDEYVVTHALVDGATVVVDIFRFEGGLIVEHWDVLQPAAR